MEEEDHIATFLLNEPPLSPIRRVAIEQDTPHDMNQPRSIETLSQTEIETEIPTEIYSDEEGVEILQGDPVGKKKEPIEGEHQNQVVQPNSTNTSNAIEEEVKGDDSKRVTRTCMMTVGKYFRSINDFINLEKTCKEYGGIMEQYHFNPIMFEKDKEYMFFPEIETFHFYGNSWSKKEFDLNRINTLPNNTKIRKIIVHEDVSLNAIGSGNNNVDFRHIKGIFTLGMDERINLLCGVNNRLGESTIKDLVIPTHITGLDNKCFCFNTFDNRYLSTRIESIFIPTSVISLGNYCFSKCYGLTRVDIPTSITKIPICCFDECTSLSSIQLPDTIEYIDDSAFINCLRLSRISIPSHVKELNFKCFFNCVNLSTIKIPSTLKRRGSWCFAMCCDLVNLVPYTGDDTLQGIELPSSIVDIGRSVFSTCTSISTVNINASIRELDTDCFINCYSLSSIKLPITLKGIQHRAFQNCSKLTGITLPNSIEHINYYVFSNCHSLSSITLSSSLRVLGRNCFDGCNNLTTIRVPSNLTFINLSGTWLFNHVSIPSFEIKWISPDNDIELTKEKKDSA